MAQSFSRAFVGDVVNPVTDARTSAAYSINRLAKKLGLSRQYITRVEQGTYTSINPSVIQWTAENKVIPKGEVVRRYNEFQIATRRNTVEEIAPIPLGRRSGDNRPGHEIFSAWREGYWPSIIAFCNGMCLHPETIKTYEEGVRPIMPEPLKKALAQVNLIDESFEGNSATAGPGAQAPQRAV